MLEYNMTGCMDWMYGLDVWNGWVICGSIGVNPVRHMRSDFKRVSNEIGAENHQQMGLR